MNLQTPQKLRLGQFKSTAEFWQFHTDHPEAFRDLDVRGTIDLAKKLEDRLNRKAERQAQKAQNNVVKRIETASNNGEKRGDNGDPRPSIEEIVWAVNPPEPPNDNYRKPPKEHQFKPGNPGGPGAPKGPRSMRKIIRAALFTDMGGTIANAVACALFKEALRGNTHALRLIVENGNNRRKPLKRT